MSMQSQHPSQPHFSIYADVILLSPLAPFFFNTARMLFEKKEKKEKKKRVVFSRYGWQKTTAVFPAA